jgi:hypothetical protein
MNDSKSLFPWFPYPNDKTRSDEDVKAAFKAEGLEVVDIQREMYMWTWVLCTDGTFWLHDKSHGGGGRFSLQSR